MRISPESELRKVQVDNDMEVKIDCLFDIEIFSANIIGITTCRSSKKMVNRNPSLQNRGVFSQWMNSKKEGFFPFVCVCVACTYICVLVCVSVYVHI